MKFCGDGSESHMDRRGRWDLLVPYSIRGEEDHLPGLAINDADMNRVVFPFRHKPYIQCVPLDSPQSLVWFI